MKKRSTVIQNEDEFLVCSDRILDDIALVCSKFNSKEKGLLNVKTRELVGDFGEYSTIVDCQRRFILQSKELIKDGKKESIIKFIRVYDTLNKRMIIDNFIEVAYFGNGYILQSPMDRKYYIFDEVMFEIDNYYFAKSFDEVEGSQTKVNNIVRIGDKKGLYYYTQGLILPVEYDDIIRDKDVIIAIKGKNELFVTSKGEISEEEYEDIKVDKKYNFIYCKKNGLIDIYEIYNNQKIFTISCDEIECVTSEDNMPDWDSVFKLNFNTEYYFKFNVNNLMGICSFEKKDINRKNQYKILLNANYDDIEYNIANNDWILHSRGKVGLYKKEERCSDFVESRYSKVEYLTNNYYAFFSENGLCDIRKIMSKDINIIPVDKCKVIDVYKDIIAYEKDGKYGLLITDKKGVVKNIFGYSNIRRLFDYYYEFEENNSKGVIYRDNVIIKADTKGKHKEKYESIKIGVASNFDKSSECVYFYFENNYGYGKRSNLVRYLHGSSLKVEKVFSTDSFFNIDFFKDIMVIYGKLNVKVYDYNLNFLNVFSFDTKISEFEKGDDGYNRYSIAENGNEKIYFYNNGKLEEIYIQNCKLYITTYECKYGTIVVNNYDKEKHDKICRSIENIGDMNIEKRLINMYEKNSKIKEKYPTLIRKK